MGHWTNSKQQTLAASSGTVTTVDFDLEIAPGSQTAEFNGLYDYAYHVNLFKPSGEAAPSRVTSVMAIARAVGGVDTIRESRAFGYIDQGSELSLSHTGRTPLSVGDTVRIRVNLDSPEQQETNTVVRQRMSSLTVDLVGASPSGNTAGTSFPTFQLTTGREFYRTDLREKFSWDGSSWLGEIRTDGAGRQGNITIGTYLRRYNGLLMSATNGIYIPWDAKITEFSWVKNGIEVGNFEIHRNGVVLSVLNGNLQAGSATLNVDFQGSGIMAFLWNGGLTTADIQVVVTYRRRFTPV